MIELKKYMNFHLKYGNTAYEGELMKLVLT